MYCVVTLLLWGTDVMEGVDGSDGSVGDSGGDDDDDDVMDEEGVGTSSGSAAKGKKKIEDKVEESLCGHCTDSSEEFESLMNELTVLRHPCVCAQLALWY